MGLNAFLSSLFSSTFEELLGIVVEEQDLDLVVNC